MAFSSRWQTRLVYGGLWLAFLLYANLLAPPVSPGTWDLILKLSTGQWEGINPLLIAIFNVMGLIPLLYGMILIPLDHGRKFPAGLVIALMMGVGAFALLPYLAWREPREKLAPDRPWWIKLFASRWLAVPLGLGILALGNLALGGNFQAFIAQWQQQQFVHVMTLDFLLLTALLPVLIAEDIAVRQIQNPWLSMISWVPLIGPVAYLILRDQRQ